jgi:cysteine synthase A
METQNGLEDSIGRTPLFRLRGPSTATGRATLSRAEFLNPGWSHKDRSPASPIRVTGQRGPQATPMDAVGKIASSGRAGPGWIHG